MPRNRSAYSAINRFVPLNLTLSFGGNMDKHWCMCTKLKAVARDGWSTCSICGGKDAYGESRDRPPDKRKVLDNQEIQRIEDR